MTEFEFDMYLDDIEKRFQRVKHVHKKLMFVIFIQQVIVFALLFLLFYFVKH